MRDGIYLHKRKDYIAIKQSDLFGIRTTLSFPSILDDLTLTDLRMDWIWVCEY